ncbi:hypothetical protein C8Q75DRAFT_811665 [Abortiporus biennis]|nr:hypothetical protein C8Q75DRAFT_811665 [Abortiporus biennis]
MVRVTINHPRSRRLKGTPPRDKYGKHSGCLLRATVVNVPQIEANWESEKEHGGVLRILTKLDPNIPNNTRNMPRFPSLDPAAPLRFVTRFNLLEEGMSSDDAKNAIRESERRCYPPRLPSTALSDVSQANIFFKSRKIKSPSSSTLAAKKRQIIRLFKRTDEGLRWISRKARLAANPPQSIFSRVKTSVVGAVGTVFTFASSFVLGSNTRKPVSISAETRRQRRDRRDAREAMADRGRTTPLRRQPINWGPRTLVTWEAGEDMPAELRSQDASEKSAACDTTVPSCHQPIHEGPATSVTWKANEEMSAELRFQFSDMKRRDAQAAEEHPSSPPSLKRDRGSVDDDASSEGGQPKKRRLED